MAKKVKRQFHGRRKGVPFTVETTLTNAAAMKILAKVPGDFAQNCAFELARMDRGLTPKAALIAWAFKLAEQGPPVSTEPIQLPKTVLASVAVRRPLKRLTPAGNPVVVRLCGELSKHAGEFAITNGGAFRSPDAAFYGYATPEGMWKPTGATPEGIVEFLKNFG